jgi:hypothetical protein
VNAKINFGDGHCYAQFLIVFAVEDKTSGIKNIAYKGCNE